MFETRTVHIILRNPLHFFITINYYLYGIYLYIDTAPVQSSNLPRLLAWYLRARVRVRYKTHTLCAIDLIVQITKI